MSALHADTLTERSAIATFLQNIAKAWREHARNLLSDTMQNKPLADEYKRVAEKFEATAEAIKRGNHWR